MQGIAIQRSFVSCLTPHPPRLMHALNAFEVIILANLTIRNLDETVKTSLRLRAARHNCSMEEEARQILKTALQNIETGLGSRIHNRFAAIGGVDLSMPERSAPRSAPVFDDIDEGL